MQSEQMPPMWVGRKINRVQRTHKRKLKSQGNYTEIAGAKFAFLSPQECQNNFLFRLTSCMGREADVAAGQPDKKSLRAFTSTSARNISSFRFFLLSFHSGTPRTTEPLVYVEMSANFSFFVVGPLMLYLFLALILCLFLYLFLSPSARP